MSEAYDFAMARLDWPEGPLIERKAEKDHKDWPKTLVAFANSTSTSERAILFIGASNRRPHKGIAVDRVDEIQRNIHDIASDKCYPSIPIQIVPLAFEQDGKDCHVVAVIVRASTTKPHFSGGAYTRQGSKSLPASADLYRELIAAHNTVAGRLLHWKGQQIQWKLIGRNQFYFLGNATIKEVTGLSAMIQDDDTGYGHPIPLSDIEILERGSLRPVLEIKYWASDRELMEHMLNRWSFFVSANAEQYHPQYDYLVRQIDLHPEEFEHVVNSMVTGNQSSPVISAIHKDLLERLGKGPKFSVMAGKHLTEILTKVVLSIPGRF
jgi:hypothetical protein